jgi:TadE-like protein
MISRLFSFLRQFSQNKSGVAGIEFAIILPLMATLFFGINELSRGFEAKRKLYQAVRVSVDISGQYSTLSNDATKNDLADIIGVGGHIMWPYKGDNLAIRLTGVDVDEKGNKKVRWSQGSNYKPALGCGANVDIPASMMPPSGKAGFVIWGEGAFLYDPITTYIFESAITFNEDYFWIARHDGTVAMEPEMCPPSN